MAHTMVIFGASGDLTSRKLIPALYELFRKRRLPEQTRIVGTSRTEYSHDTWRSQLAESTAQFVGERFDSESWQKFAANIFYTPGDIGQAEDFVKLRSFLTELENDRPATRVYYLSTAPRFYQQAVHEVFAEHQVYRIDHYLGKETVSNILAFRFANTIFEPVWNRNYIDHVQITAAEEVTIGHRAGFYESAGVLRDMFQNHLMQLFTLTAMEAPARFEADSVRDEKVKVLRAVRPMRDDDVAKNTVRGQYRSYRDEPNVDPRSNTATFGAARLCIDNWRWQGVPFYLRSLKAASCRTTQIVIQFRQPPHVMFETESLKPFDANRLILQIQPAEGIQLQFQTKVPDTGMQLRMTDLDFRFRAHFAGELPEAYQPLLLDAMLGDASLFARSDEVELAWGIVDPIQRVWDSTSTPPLSLYAEGDWGPATSNDWMRQQGRQWFDICPVLH